MNVPEMITLTALVGLLVALSATLVFIASTRWHREQIRQLDALARAVRLGTLSLADSTARLRAIVDTRPPWYVRLARRLP